jgi:hypothetical protein
MKQMLKLAAISVALMVNFGVAYAQNTPAPSRKMASETPLRRQPLGKMTPKTNKDRYPDANSESRMNDNPPPQERIGAPNTAPN